MKPFEKDIPRFPEEKLLKGAPHTPKESVLLEVGAQESSLAVTEWLKGNQGPVISECASQERRSQLRKYLAPIFHNEDNCWERMGLKRRKNYQQMEDAIAIHSPTEEYLSTMDFFGIQLPDRTKPLPTEALTLVNQAIKTILPNWYENLVPSLSNRSIWVMAENDYRDLFNQFVTGMKESYTTKTNEELCRLLGNNDKYEPLPNPLPDFSAFTSLVGKPLVTTQQFVNEVYDPKLPLPASNAMMAYFLVHENFHRATRPQWFYLYPNSPFTNIVTAEERYQMKNYPVEKRGIYQQWLDQNHQYLGKLPLIIETNGAMVELLYRENNINWQYSTAGYDLNEAVVQYLSTPIRDEIGRIVSKIDKKSSDLYWLMVKSNVNDASTRSQTLDRKEVEKYLKYLGLNNYDDVLREYVLGNIPHLHLRKANIREYYT